MPLFLPWPIPAPTCKSNRPAPPACAQGCIAASLQVMKSAAPRTQGDAAEAWADAGGAPARDPDGCFAAGWLEAHLGALQAPSPPAASPSSSQLASQLAPPVTAGPLAAAGPEPYLCLALNWACASDGGFALALLDLELAAEPHLHPHTQPHPQQQRVAPAGSSADRAAPTTPPRAQRARRTHSTHSAPLAVRLQHAALGSSWPRVAAALQPDAASALRSLSTDDSPALQRALLRLDGATSATLLVRAAAAGVRLPGAAGHQDDLHWVACAAAAGVLGSPQAAQAAGRVFIKVRRRTCLRVPLCCAAGHEAAC